MGSIVVETTYNVGCTSAYGSNLTSEVVIDVDTLRELVSHMREFPSDELVTLLFVPEAVPEETEEPEDAEFDASEDDDDDE